MVFVLERREGGGRGRGDGRGEETFLRLREGGRKAGMESTHEISLILRRYLQEGGGKMGDEDGSLLLDFQASLGGRRRKEKGGKEGDTIRHQPDRR